MVSIKWLKFLSLIISFYFSANYIFLTVFFALWFRIFIVTLWFLRIFSPRRLSFSFPLPLLFPFFFFPHFPFVPFFLSYFPFFLFLICIISSIGLLFPKSAATVLPYFLLPFQSISNWYSEIFKAGAGLSSLYHHLNSFMPVSESWPEIFPRYKRWDPGSYHFPNFNSFHACLLTNNPTTGNHGFPGEPSENQYQVFLNTQTEK